MSDEEDQLDEIGAIGSIYNEEEYIISMEDDGQRSGTFFAFLNLPKGFCVKYKTLKNGTPKWVVIPVEHLPPIRLFFKLPKNYPSQAMPEFTLSCPWMSVTKLVKLCNKMEDLWKEWKGSVILYTWTHFLKEESLEWIGIKDNLDISRRHLVELRRLGAKRNNNKQINVTNNDSRDRPPIDSRVYLPALNIPLHEFLESFNEDRSRTIFLRNIYTCVICFQETSGSKCLQFKPCDHIYCKQCMAQYFESRINDNMVTSMPCPHEKCTSEAHPQQVKDTIEPQLFNKYDKLLLSVTLDQMDDITYCPRISCGSPVMREKEEKMAACPNCFYVFCVFCRRAYHGIAPCRIKTVEIQKIIDEYTAGDDEVKARLIKKYGNTQIQGFINELKSNDWIQSNSKQCPNCNTCIEKSDGCNKMVCGKCNSFFCWLCLSILNTHRPYDHFMDSRSPCQNQLFFNPDVGNVEDDEDFDGGEFGYEILDAHIYIDDDDFNVGFEF